MTSATDAPIDTGHWQARLTELLAKHKVAGATLGILWAGEISAFAAGFANVPEEIEATPDTLFQIGSITKVWTATQIMQLVDEGKVELDRRVLDYLPGVKLSDDSITVRQLLNHTSGLLGDHMLDCGRGDDNLEKYIASMAGLQQLHPVGGGWSYCNSAFSILGRVIEVIDGKTWDASLRARIIEPLGLTHTVTLPEEALRRRVACGHTKGDDDAFAVVPEWGISRSAGPAGLISARVADLLGFARLHLDGGKAPDGTQVLSAESAEAMITPTAEVTEKWLLGKEMGLGWFLDEWSGELVYGHGGDTLGQSAYFKIIPGQGLALALLTNGGGGVPLHLELFEEIARELAGITMSSLPSPTEGEVSEPERYVGTYASAAQVQRVLVNDDGALVVEVLDEKSGKVAMTMPLLPFLPDTLLAEFAGAGFYLPVTFLDYDGVRSIHNGGRAKPEAPDWKPSEPADPEPSPEPEPETAAA